MRLDTIRAAFVLKELSKRDDTLKGAQPELVLGCFYSLNTERTEEVCEKCRDYEFICRHFLNSFKINENPYESHMQEVYEMLKKEKI